MLTQSRKTNTTLWIAQGALAALFIFGGGYKLIAPSAALAQMSPFPPLFLKFIGFCEITGGLGLILPGLFGIRTELTSLAATGLSIIMAGAVITTVLTLSAAPAIIPFVVGVVTTIIARGRRPRASQSGAAFGSPLQTRGI